MTREQRWFRMCCGLLRGERQVWPADAALDAPGRLHEFLLFHGIDCLVLETIDLLEGCPSQLRELLRQSARARAQWELRDRQTMTATLDVLQRQGVATLVYKGTALAYMLYENPVWRARSDTDLLVHPQQVAEAALLLTQGGFTQCRPEDEIILHKLYFTQSAPEGGEHHIDLHWKLNNSELLAGLFTFDELRSRARPVPALGTGAFTLSRVDAMLVACLHRDSHRHAHYTVGAITTMTADRLVWICDIDRLARAFSAAEWQDLFALARAKGLTTSCRHNLLMAQQCCATPLPGGWQAQLTVEMPARADRYLLAGPLPRLWFDLLAYRGVVARAGFLRHLLFPPAAYMYNKYAEAGVRWLPWLYLRRMVAGFVSRVSGARQ